MITVKEALSFINSHRRDFGTETVELQNALGRVLRESWHSDRPLPPYNRVMMDGIAIQYDSFLKGQRTFPVAGIAPAGSPQLSLEDGKNCFEVMTGAVKPKDTDVVIRYEDIRIEDKQATVLIDQITRHQNIHPMGSDRRADELIVAEGTTIGTAELGVAASLGKTHITVTRLPKAIVISTGDELVDIHETPEAHQIRRSNVYQIKAVLSEIGIQADFAHLLDDKHHLREKLRQFLEDYDVILLSGGVSKGKFDFLPEVLAELNVTKSFHRVSQRPGKPFWFGHTDECTVFALPGNPISSFLCTHKYFKHWLHQSLFKSAPKPTYAILQNDVNFKPDLTYFLEVKIESALDGTLLAFPMKGNGSGDLANLVRANAFIELPQGSDIYPQGEVYKIWRY